MEALSELTALGFSIAVDDVGAGYSGLEKIARLSPRYLKFDRELIRDIDSSYIRREMTRALKAFADSIGSAIIAEGIERQGEARHPPRPRRRVRPGLPPRPARPRVPASLTLLPARARDVARAEAARPAPVGART